MIITLTGLKGSGKSTTARLLAERLGYTQWSVGDAKREVAEQMGLTIREFDKLSNTDPEKYHKLYDERTRAVAQRDDVIVDGNIAFFFLPESFKIFVTASDVVRGKRVFSKTRPGEKQYTSWEDALEATDERMNAFRDDAVALYGPECDMLDRENFDLLVDTSDMTPEEVVSYIIAEAEKRGVQL